ncbi:MAG TPA: hypothetical protein VFB45_10575 [Pseudolabrys sp.]|nr:hypothetical protein [Pseudolabrys sp.]
MIDKLPGVLNTSVVGGDRRPTTSDLKQRKLTADRLNGDKPVPSFQVGEPAGTNMGAGTLNAEKLYDNGARVLSTAGNQTLAGGFLEQEYDNGTPANGATVIIDPVNGLKQKVTNNVPGFTIQPMNKVGDVELRIVNGASAGSITFSGFSKQFPSDALDTTNAHQFVAFIYGWGAAGIDFIIKARQ